MNLMERLWRWARFRLKGLSLALGWNPQHHLPVLFVHLEGFDASKVESLHVQLSWGLDVFRIRDICSLWGFNQNWAQTYWDNTTGHFKAWWMSMKRLLVLFAIRQRKQPNPYWRMAPWTRAKQSVDNAMALKYPESFGIDMELTDFWNTVHA